jgi:hypothetical protein
MRSSRVTSSPRAGLVARDQDLLSVRVPSSRARIGVGPVSSAYPRGVGASRCVSWGGRTPGSGEPCSSGMQRITFGRSFRSARAALTVPSCSGAARSCGGSRPAARRRRAIRAAAAADEHRLRSWSRTGRPVEVWAVLTDWSLTPTSRCGSTDGSPGCARTRLTTPPRRRLRASRARPPCRRRRARRARPPRRRSRACSRPPPGCRRRARWP